MRENDAKLNRCKKLLATPPKVDRNREPPKCRLCPYYQPEFRYRKCLYAVCPYGKDRNTAFRRRPLKSEKIVATGRPDAGAMARGLTHPTLPEGSLTTALAYISTNAAVTAGIYGTYLGLEKKWKKEDLFNGAMTADAVTHIVTVVLISGAIVLVGAIVLHPQGIAIKAPAQLGNLFRPFLGNAAPIVMGIAIIGAGFSSLLGNTQRGVVLLNAGLFMVLILWKQELYTGYKTPRVLQVSMTICYIFAVYMTVIALRTQIPNLINSFIGG